MEFRKVTATMAARTGTTARWSWKRTSSFTQWVRPAFALPTPTSWSPSKPTSTYQARTAQRKEKSNSSSIVPPTPRPISRDAAAKSWPPRFPTPSRRRTSRSRPST
uniref:(northern house mosquito) hypothetical protein n=1 Tax=Culex pipiens TaxID=7175 RepID=A0A8D8J9D3_CULPI